MFLNNKYSHSSINHTGSIKLPVFFSKYLLNDQYDLKNEVLNNSSTGLNFVKISLNIASDSNLNTITPFMI